MSRVADLARFSTAHRRPENQDVCFVLGCQMQPYEGADLLILGVLDGISNAQGRESSRVSADAACRFLAGGLMPEAMGLAHMEPDRRDARILQALRQSICQADEALRAMGNTYGSTISLAVVCCGKVYTANIGDSPIYLYRDTGFDSLDMVPMFESHSGAAELVRRGILTEEEARTSPERNRLLRFLCSENGMEPQSIPVFAEELTEPATLLLGSDGALSVLHQSELNELVYLYGKDCRALNRCLYDKISNTDSTDNYTLLAARLAPG